MIMTLRIEILVPFIFIYVKLKEVDLSKITIWKFHICSHDLIKMGEIYLNLRRYYFVAI